MLKAAAEVGQGRHLGSTAATTHVSRLGNITTETLGLAAVLVRVTVYGDSMRIRRSLRLNISLYEFHQEKELL